MSDSKSLTLEIAEFTTGQSAEALSDELSHLAKRCILDGLAVMLAGSRTRAATIVRSYVSESGATGKSTILGSDMTANAGMAALANGVSGHALDYDDTQLSSAPDRVYGLLTHPTVPVLVPSLAMAQEIGANPKDVLAAFCIGFEVECKVAEAIYPDHYRKGFHSTGTIGVFGAAAATSRLLDLSLQQTRFALGIAASKSAGIRVNFGTMTKPYHSGAAAENGMIAAKLARLGYEADPDALDGQWGFFQVAGGGCDAEIIRGRLGNPWSMIQPGVSVKPYPCGSLAHPSMDALLDMVRENDIKPEHVEEISLGTSSNVLAALRYKNPQNELEAKFSIPFCLGILALERKAGIQQFRDEVVRCPDVREMMGKVRAYLDHNIEARGYDRIRSLVGVKLKDGRSFQKEADTSRGTPQRPMSDLELEAKFQECASEVLRQEDIAKALQAIWHLDKLKDINQLLNAVSYP